MPEKNDNADSIWPTGRIAPPLEAKWAVRFSLLSVPVGIACLLIAHSLFLQSWTRASLFWALVMYMMLGVAWSFLEWPSRNAVVRGNNVFVLVVMMMVVVALITTKQGEAFPQWAIVTCIVAGVGGYSVAGVYAVRNFLRWRRGVYG